MQTLQEQARAAQVAREDRLNQEALALGDGLLGALSELVGRPIDVRVEVAEVSGLRRPVVYIDNLCFTIANRPRSSRYRILHLSQEDSGLTIGAEKESSPALPFVALVQRCDDCGQLLHSAPLRELADLNVMLTRFILEDYRDCPAATEEPTDDQRILAVRNFIQAWGEVDNLYQG